jgi:uncharacterized protein
MNWRTLTEPKAPYIIKLVCEGVEPVNIDISELKDDLGASMDVSFRESMEPLLLGGTEIPFQGPVCAELSILNEGNCFSLYGSVHANAILTCSRCLKPLVFPLNGNVEARYCEEQEEPAGDEELLPLEGSKIDIIPALREALILAMPVKIICSESCKGLCSICGKDLNQGDCDCQVQEIDSRLIVLKELLKD